MRTYSITDPSGKVHTIDGPEGATREQVIAKIQERLSSQPSAPVQQDPYTATAQKQSVGKNLLAGIGGGMYGLYLGGKQLLGQATPEEVMQHKQAMEGLRSTTAGTVGDVIGNVAAAIPTAFIPGANTYAGAGLIGAGLGALQPTTENDSRGANMAMGAGGGIVGKFAGDKILGLLRGNAPKTATNLNAVGDDVSAGLTESQKRALDAGKKLGMRVTPGQAAGSKSVQQMEAKFASQPFTSGAFNAIDKTNQTVINREWAKAIGEKANVIDDEVLNRAQQRLSANYKKVADDTVRKIDPDDFLGRFSKIELDNEGMLPGVLADHPLVKRLVNFATTGQATGKQLQPLSSQLGNAATAQMRGQSGNRELGMALFDVKNIVDDYLRQGLKGDTLKMFNDTVAQYRNYSTLLKPGVIQQGTGNISAPTLSNVLARTDKNGFTLGRNRSPHYEAVRFKQAFRPIINDSGTATRMQQIPSPADLLLQAPGTLAGYAYTSKPIAGMAQGMGAGISPELAAILMKYKAAGALPGIMGGAGGASLSNQ